MDWKILQKQSEDATDKDQSAKLLKSDKVEAEDLPLEDPYIDPIEFPMTLKSLAQNPIKVLASKASKKLIDEANKNATQPKPALQWPQTARESAQNPSPGSKALTIKSENKVMDVSPTVLGVEEAPSPLTQKQLIAEQAELARTINRQQAALNAMRTLQRSRGAKIPE